MRGRSLAEGEASLANMNTAAPLDMCLVVLPLTLYSELSEQARVRNQTLAEFLAAAVDSYVGVKPVKVEASYSNFEIEEPSGRKPPRLKGFY
jgi:hypothetical protein